MILLNIWDQLNLLFYKITVQLHAERNLKINNDTVLLVLLGYTHVAMLIPPY